MLSELDTAQDSFDKLHKWVCDIKENTSPNVPLTLLGNKCDLKKKDNDHFLKAKVTVTSKVSITIGQYSYH